MQPMKWNEGGPLSAIAESASSGFGAIFEDEEAAGEGGIGFTVFDENPALPPHLVARLEGQQQQHKQMSGDGENQSESASTTQQHAQQQHQQQQQVPEPVPQPVPALSSTDFFANIFEDEDTSVRASTKKSTSAKPSFGSTRKPLGQAAEPLSANNAVPAQKKKKSKGKHREVSLQEQEAIDVLRIVRLNMIFC